MANPNVYVPRLAPCAYSVCDLPAVVAEWESFWNPHRDNPCINVKLRAGCDYMVTLPWLHATAPVIGETLRLIVLRQTT
jgi:hypothetical protein